MTVQKLADAFLGAKAPPSGLPDGAQPTGTVWGVVVSVQTGPPPTLTVTLGGSSTSVAGVRFLNGYFPAVSDTVLIWQAGSDLFVVDTLAPAGGQLVPPIITKQNISGVDISLNTSGPVEVHTSLRITGIIVPPSGKLAVTNSAQLYNNFAGALDAKTYAAAWDSGGSSNLTGWIETGGIAFFVAGQNSVIPGSCILTGLTPGNTVRVYMGWYSSGNNVAISAATRGAFVSATWQQVQSLIA